LKTTSIITQILIGPLKNLIGFCTHLNSDSGGDVRLFCKNKSKTGNVTEKQAQHALEGKFNKTKNQQVNKIKPQRGNPKNQAQNEQTSTKTRPICL